MDVSSQMLLFVKVVEMGSISAVSRSAGQMPSTVSRQIRQLEDHAGYRLLHRKKTGVSLTAEGREFYEKCRAVADTYCEAEELISGFGGRPRGVLHVASSVAFGKAQLIPILPRFLSSYPEITFSLELTDRVIDVEEEDFDAAINFAEQQQNPNVITRKIMKNERILCASPEYIERHGSPVSFDDLVNFNCLRTSDAADRNDWRAEMGGIEYNVGATGNFQGNSADTVYRATLAGLGIARLSTYLVTLDIASGALVRVLPEYTQKHADITVAFADRRNLAPKTRVFVEFLADHFKHAKNGNEA
ncbi:LysR family transcriptional regulator [Roseovarius sp. CAU 1744]|uniref:LysR family transcriptional regulator n=1 Tax=Roseovarius sp. CAU 1744 TaxID=3140368 RepID=UPI00325A8EC8